MRQKLVAFILSLCAITATGFAANCNRCQKPSSGCTCSTSDAYSSCDLGCSCCECVPKPSCHPPCDAAYNAPYRIGVCWDFFLTGSFIYWQAIEDGLETGITVSGNLDQDQCYENFCFDFNPGFKVGLGFNFDWDNWDLFLEYTWLHSCERLTNSGARILPLYILTDVFGDELRTQWDFDFDMIDFNVGRPCYVGRFLVVRPHFGGKAFWLDQEIHQKVIENDVVLIKGDNTSNTWAVGARAGLETRWDFYCGFYMYGNGAYSLLYTQIDSVRVSTDVLDDGTKKLSEKKTFTPSAELSLGLGWADYVDCKSRWFLNIFLGYEFLAFLDQNQFRIIYSTNSVDNNLYLQGLTVGFRLDF